jgi:hypothetical protein
MSEEQDPNPVVDNQALLFEPQEDPALLFCDEELAKRYTADQACKLRWKREAIVMLIAAGWPTEDIARRLEVNTRTVRALAARDAEKVAGSLKSLGGAMLQTGARWFGLARAKESEAQFRDLAIAGGIALQRGGELLAMGEVAEETNSKRADRELERSGAAERIRAMLAAAPAVVEVPAAFPAPSPAPGGEEPADLGRNGTGPIDLESVGADSGEVAARLASNAWEGGGGRVSRAGGETTMGLPETGLQAKVLPDGHHDVATSPAPEIPAPTTKAEGEA